MKKSEQPAEKKDVQKIDTKVLKIPDEYHLSVGPILANTGVTDDWDQDPWGDGWNPNPWYGGKDMNQLWPLLNGEEDIDVEEATRELVDLIKNYPDLVKSLMSKLSKVQAEQQIQSVLDSDED